MSCLSTLGRGEMSNPVLEGARSTPAPRCSRSVIRAPGGREGCINETTGYKEDGADELVLSFPAGQGRDREN
jgi:hypothetical protein